MNPVIRRGSTKDRNRQEEQGGNPQTNDDKMVTWQGPSQRFEPATDWDRETNLTKGRHRNFTQEADQLAEERPAASEHHNLKCLLETGHIRYPHTYYNTLPCTKNAI